LLTRELDFKQYSISGISGFDNGMYPVVVEMTSGTDLLDPSNNCKDINVTSIFKLIDTKGDRVLLDYHMIPTRDPLTNKYYFHLSSHHQ
jgi:hypothetical protein